MADISEHLIRKPIVEFLFRYLERVGCDPTPFRQRCEWIRPESTGLEPALRMVFFLTLLEEVAEETSNPDLGLHYYVGADWADLGLYGFATMHAGTIGDAVALDCRHSQMLQNHAHFSAESRSTGELVYEYRLLAPDLPGSRYDNDLAIAGMVFGIRILAGTPDWVPRGVELMHPRPRQLDEYTRLIGNCSIKFNAAANRLLIDPEMAARSVQGRDPRLFSVLEADLERLLSVSQAEILESVRREVMINMHGGVLSIDEMSERLNLSRRSLQRRLADEGYTYKQLVEQLREQVAIRYLRDNDSSLVDIALLLGYSELSALIRAFRRWTGETPQQYRSRTLD